MLIKVKVRRVKKAGKVKGGRINVRMSLRKAYRRKVQLYLENHPRSLSRRI